MKIDLTIINFSGIEAAYYNVRYARIDNITSPVFIPSGSPTSAQFPYTVSNVDNGQYEVGITPVYNDGRACSEVIQQTLPCQGIIALNATQVGTNLQITYTAPGQVPQVYLTVLYPNGGSFTGAYTNGANSSTILIPIPSGVNGTYQVYMQSICDPNTSFYSTATPPINVTVGGSNSVAISTDAAGVTITAINGIAGYSLSQPLTSGMSDSGVHGGFTGSISGTFTGTPAVSCSASLYVNGSLSQCINLPNTSGGTIAFTSATYYSTDLIEVDFNLGGC